MRPVSITLEGFSAYRRRQMVSLRDAEFFSLSGPTGSGKSSLIDAMVFALYGRVPRLGARAVAPVITAGADRARVSFEFEVRGDMYLVSRVAERTDSGASVREARLERADGTSMASGAGEVTREIEELLRLRFEDFTKTVVLPQGEFARFLNAGSRERRELLRDLLGLDVYTRVRELAGDRKSEAAGRAGSARHQLESLDVPSDHDVDEARSRLGALQDLARDMGGQLERLAGLEKALDATVAKMEGLEDARTRLERIAPPEHLEEMDERLVAAREAETLAEEALGAKKTQLEAVRSEMDGLASEETIANARLAHEGLITLDERMAELDVTGAREAVTQAQMALERDESMLADARAAQDAAKVSHAAHTVSATLVVGEPCPVCAQEVASVPEIEPPPELAQVEETVAVASAAARSSREDLLSTQARLAEVEARHSELEAQRDSLRGRLAETPPLEQLAADEERLADLSRRLDELKTDIEGLETALRRARREHEDAAEAVRSVDRALGLARDTVADLKPPYPDSDDPMTRWKELLSWRDSAAESIDAEKEEVAGELERERGKLGEMQRDLVSALEEVGVSPEKPYDVAVARAVEQARNRVTRLEEVSERAHALEEELEESKRVEAVATALANHLRANGFERWLMAGAITGLVNGANELLAQLSGGGYSLEADDEGSFRIIDHRNADEIRDVATLSGGETFLVSLALSLSLAETLSASGGAGLDAIILDEGFGTLDEESLDVVAAVLEELAGRGLMVGVITHVKELAARAPVRFQVTREPEGSKVEMMT